MFYFGRYFATAKDPAKRDRYNGLWQYPYFRFINRVITVVWGVAYAGEFILRVILVLLWNHVPMLAAREANQMARKAAMRSGAHSDAPACWLVNVAFFIIQAPQYDKSILG